MSKQKFNVLVTRTEEYEIEIDTSAWNEEGIKQWNAVFTEAEGPVDIAKILAIDIAREGIKETVFYEGFGYVKRFFIGMDGPEQIKDEKKQYTYNSTISATLIDEQVFDAEAYAVASCRVCGCTEKNCSGCVERTGEPCHWVEADLCSACVNFKS